MTNINTNAHALTPKPITEALDAMLTIKRPTFVWGPPGIGKSAIVKQIAQRRGIGFIDMRATQKDPIDLRGIPVEKDGQTKWLPPDDLPVDGEGILFLDELNTAPPLTQAAFYQLILDREIGNYKLPEGWSIIAAGNLESDRAVTHRMPTPLANRFTHLELMVDLDEWVEWALQNSVRDEVIAYLRYRPDQLHVFDPASGEKRFPTPRAWAAVSDIVGAELVAPVEYATIAGTVGDGSAAELAGFLKIFRKLPSPDSILLNPETAPVPADDPATMYALSSLVSRRADSDNFDRVWTYTQRMTDEFCVLTMVTAARRDASLMDTRQWIEFATKHAELVL